MKHAELNIGENCENAEELFVVSMESTKSVLAE